jgi:hypothetical protein
MNEHNIKQFVKEYFKKDDIQREEIYDSSFEGTDFYENPVIYYNVPYTFTEYIQDMIDNVQFYRYCRYKRRLDNINVDEIRYEIECSDTSYTESDLSSVKFVYNWYFVNRLQYIMSKRFDFFLNIMDDIENETKK